MERGEGGGTRDCIRERGIGNGGGGGDEGILLIVGSLMFS